MSKLIIVAEIKLRSPFDYIGHRSFTKELELANSVGDIIAVHTSPLWGGSYEMVTEVKARNNKPVLAKGFHCTQPEIDRAFRAGADYVLTVGWWNGNHNCWHECESLLELANSKALRAVWNSRNPRTGETREETFAQARAIRGNKFLCQASNIETINDVGNANAVLVGTHLKSFKSSMEACKLAG